MVQCQLVKLGWGLHLKSFPKATWLYSYQDISLQPIFIIHINQNNCPLAIFIPGHLTTTYIYHSYQLISLATCYIHTGTFHCLQYSYQLILLYSWQDIYTNIRTNIFPTISILPGHFDRQGINRIQINRFPVFSDKPKWQREKIWEHSVLSCYFAISALAKKSPLPAISCWADTR